LLNILEKDDYLNKIKEMIEVDSEEADNVIDEGYYEFLIEHFNNIWYTYSPQFQIGDYDW